MNPPRRIHFISFPILVLIVALAVISSGCASLGSYNTATGRNELIFIPTSEEVAMGQTLHNDISRQYRISTDKEKYDRLVRIGTRVAQVSDRQDYQYKFFLVESEDLNAFTTPGGHIYFFTGLFDRMTTDDQIAAVLAHEIGHCAAKHTIKKFQAALGYDLVGSIVLNHMNFGSGAKQIATMGSNVAMKLVFSAYSRKDEHQADQLGVKYMYLAGYNVNASIQILRLLLKESKGAHPPEILSTHPNLEARIKTVEQEIIGIDKKYQVD